MRSISMLFTTAIILIILSSFTSEAQQAIKCDFEDYQGQYACILSVGTVVNEDEPLNITGDHLPSKTSAEVTQVRTPPFPSNEVLMTVFHPHFLTEFPNLQEVHLAFVNLTSVDLKNCGNISVITVYETTLEEIPSGAFKSCSNLRELELIFNQIRVTYVDSFSGLVNLESLKIDANPMVRMFNNSLNDSTSLRSFTFGGGGVIEPNALQKFKNLEEVTLINLKLRQNDAKELLKGLNNLQLIDLSSNYIESEIFETLREFRSLKTLRLNFNDLSSIPNGAFDGLNDLRTLSMNMNPITVLHEDSFRGLSDLEVLYLDSNSINTLENSPFKHLEDLEELHLSYNPLRMLPDMIFERNVDLKILNVEGCKLDRITSETFKGLVELEVLDISRNNLTSIPLQTFSNMPKLQSLNIASNNLKVLSSNSFGNLPSLTVFDAMDCNLLAIEPNLFENFPSLSVFRAQRNLCVDSILFNVNEIDFKKENELSVCFENFEDEDRKNTSEPYERDTTEATTTGNGRRIEAIGVLMVSLAVFRSFLTSF